MSLIRHTRPIFLFLAVLAVAVASTGTVHAGGDHPVVSWSPESLDITVARGGSTTQTVSFVSSRELENIRLIATPGIASLVQLTPVRFEEIDENTPVLVTFMVSASATTPAGVYEGVVHLTADKKKKKAAASGKKFAKPLPVTLRVGEGIGAGGGSAGSQDGNVTLTVPSGALIETEIVTLELTGASVPSSFGAAVSPVYDFGPDGTIFAKPATAVFSYDPLSLPSGTDPSTLRVAFEVNGVWQGLPSSVDTGAHTVSANVFHFTRFALVKPAPSLQAVPAAPTGLTVAVDGSGAHLSWTPPAEHYAFAAIRRATDISGAFTLLAYGENGATTYTDVAPLGAGSCYKVSSVSPGGFESSGSTVCIPESVEETLVEQIVFVSDDAKVVAASFVDRAAQSFTVASAFHGNLTIAMKLAQTGATSGIVTVALRSDRDGPNLAIATTAADAIGLVDIGPPVSFTDVEFEFSDITLNSGDAYYLVVLTSDLNIDAIVYTAYSPDPTNSYPAGFFSQHNVVIGAWSPSAGDDMYFVITGIAS